MVRQREYNGKVVLNSVIDRKKEGKDLAAGGAVKPSRHTFIIYH
jgi:hypothetical protein